MRHDRQRRQSTSERWRKRDKVSLWQSRVGENENVLNERNIVSEGIISWLYLRMCDRDRSIFRALQRKLMAFQDI